MEPKNFPARKLARKMNAQRDMSKPYTSEEMSLLAEARNIRTKKSRRSAGLA